jgi:hypothetical protein
MEATAGAVALAASSDGSSPLGVYHAFAKIALFSLPRSFCATCPRISGYATLSMVVMQDRIGFPSMWTAQAPHSAIRHPNFVPVIPAHRGSPTTAGCPHHIDGAIDSIDFDPESHGYLWGTISVNDLQTLRATLSPLEF